jgi:predicted Zn finger-like uncharacterized protein
MPTTICGSSPAAAGRRLPDRPNDQVILTCPACRTCYLVDQQDLNRPAGRTVRCASCGHTWRHQPPLVTRLGEPAARPARPRSEPELEVPPRPGPLPAPAPPRPARRRPAALWVVLGVVLVMLALAVLVAAVGRDEVVARWPAAARLYALVGLPVEGSGLGLGLDKITPARTAEGLVIEGDITNTGNTARDVPRLRVALRDPDDKETQFKVIDPPATRLAPGETAHFKTSFDHPDEAATGVVVTFAPR